MSKKAGIEQSSLGSGCEVTLGFQAAADASVPGFETGSDGTERAEVAVI
jgi:hypothetical protein